MRTTASAVLLLAVLAAPAGATVFTVTKTADTLDGACDPYDCSLREAVVAANKTPGTDVIELPPGNYALTRTGAGEDKAATGDLDVGDPLILVGRDAATTVLDGNAADRVLDISAATELFGLTVRNGLVSGPGGGILVHRTQLDYFVVVRRSVVSDNHAAGSGGDGGGVQSDTYSPVVMLESTLSGNRADAKGGAIAAVRFWLIDSTASGNSAGQFGGGLYSTEDASPPIQGSTITANAAGREGGGISYDQFGQPRHVSCEAGAVEHPAQPVCVPGGAVLCLQDGRFQVTASWSNPDGSGGPAIAAPLTGDTGNYWFFSPQNLELTVKVIDGCALNDRFWVFTSGLTDRGVDLRVEDLWSGEAWTHHHAPGTTYGPRLDTSALNVCHLPGAPAEAGDPGTLAIDPVSAVLVVTKGEDTLDGACDHDCSLREAVAASNARTGSEAILLGNRVHTLSRAGRADLVTGNRAEAEGGGLSSPNLVVRDSTISDNQAASGGGIVGFGFLRLSNVTLSGNRARDAGGGIEIFSFDQDLDHVTITGNSAGVRGGGAFVEIQTCPSSDPTCRSDFAIRHSIVAGNQAPQFRDCSGFDTSPDSYNVFGVADGCVHGPADRAGTAASPLDPKLTELGNHGGPTPTHAPLADSPAVDLGPAAGCLPMDQRGRTRPADGDLDGAALCDAGAVERLPACQPDETTLCLGAGDRFRVTAHWTAHGEDGEAHPIPLSLDTGSFWFFAAANVELTLKILDGCAVDDRFWVFVSGLTDVRVDILVEDTVTGRTWTHHNAAGSAFQPRLDTRALDICSEGK